MRQKQSFAVLKARNVNTWQRKWWCHWHDSSEIVRFFLVKYHLFWFNTLVNILSCSLMFRMCQSTKKVSCLFSCVIGIYKDVIKHLLGSGLSQRAPYSVVLLALHFYSSDVCCVVLFAGLDADMLAVIPAFSRHPSLKHLMLGKNFNIKGRYGPCGKPAVQMVVKMILMMNVFPLLFVSSGCWKKFCRN